MNLELLGNRLIIKQAPKADTNTTDGGIQLLAAKDETTLEGVVLAVGPGVIQMDGKILAMKVSVDDSVLYNKYSGTKIKYKDEDYLLLVESDVIGIIREG